MRKVSNETVEALRAHATGHPQDSYAQMAATFGMSEISVKRYCVGLGRGKDWRKGRKVALPDSNKFWVSVDRASDGCWLWKGCLNSSGYGTVHFDGRSQGTHRVAYMLKLGAIPEGTEIDHLCRNRACCNPAHLEAITHGMNMERVRQAQAEESGGINHFPHPLIDPGTNIDTRREDRSGVGKAVVSTLINGKRLSQKPGEVARGSVSIAQGRSEPTPTSADLAVEHARDLWWRARQLWGQCRDVTRRAEDGSENFYYYAVDVDGIDFRMIARSESDAQSMVERIWGTTRKMSVWEDGKPDTDAIEDWLGDWSHYLDSQRARWGQTEPGRAWAEEKDRKKRDELQRRDDEKVTWREAWEDSLERRLASASRRAPSCARRAPRPVDEDFESYEDYESDES